MCILFIYFFNVLSLLQSVKIVSCVLFCHYVLSILVLPPALHITNVESVEYECRAVIEINDALKAALLVINS